MRNRRSSNLLRFMWWLVGSQIKTQPLILMMFYDLVK